MRGTGTAATTCSGSSSKYGLGARDLGPSLNFFSKVRVESDGSMVFVPGNSKPGDYVELRAEMNVLVAIDTGQHPLDPNPAYDAEAGEIFRYAFGPGDG